MTLYLKMNFNPSIITSWPSFPEIEIDHIHRQYIYENPDGENLIEYYHNSCDGGNRDYLNFDTPRTKELVNFINNAPESSEPLTVYSINRYYSALNVPKKRSIVSYPRIMSTTRSGHYILSGYHDYLNENYISKKRVDELENTYLCIQERVNNILQSTSYFDAYDYIRSFNDSDRYILSFLLSDVSQEYYKKTISENEALQLLKEKVLEKLNSIEIDLDNLRRRYEEVKPDSICCLFIIIGLKRRFLSLRLDGVTDPEGEEYLLSPQRFVVVDSVLAHLPDEEDKIRVLVLVPLADRKLRC